MQKKKKKEKEKKSVQYQETLGQFFNFMELI